MATEKAFESSLQGTTVEGDELSSLLKKEFKPKSDRAREVRAAVSGEEDRPG